MFSNRYIGKKENEPDSYFDIINSYQFKCKI